MRSPQQIASSLTLLADLMEINGDNDFKIRAHRVAADICAAYPEGTDSLLQKIKSPGIPKIGENLAKKIYALAEQAQIDELKELTAIVPLSVLEIRAVPGLGPKKVKALWQELHLENLESLELACKAGRLKDLKGFGEKLQVKVLEGIEQLKRYRGLMRLSRANYLFELESQIIKDNFNDAIFYKTSELRRCCEVLKSADLIVCDLDLTKLAELNRNSGLFSEVREDGDKLEMISDRGELLRVYLVPSQQIGKSLLETTGPDQFNAWIAPKLEKIQLDSTDSEAAIFTKAGIAFVAPEQREIEMKSVWGSEPLDLIQVTDIRGIIHCHSTYSDGVDQLRSMAIAAKQQGFGYLGIADHSISAKYAGGLSVERIEQQHAEIDLLNDEFAPFRILKGIESDITTDGNLDYQDSVLEKFDFVVASVHNGFQMSREEMTARIIKALKNPYTSILGHPTGRLLLEREPYQLDLEEVIRIAAEEGVIIEVNASPYRLDLDWRWIPFALSCGAKFSIDPDAHRIAGFADIRYGADVSRKGGLRKQDVVTCLEADEFLKSLR